MTTVLTGAGFALLAMTPAVVPAVLLAVVRDGSPFRRSWWQS